MAVILLRHTRPEGAAGLCYGRTDLAPAASFPEELSSILKALPEVCRIHSSPLTRCLTLAQGLAEARDLPLSIDPRLIEMDFGTWENTPWDDVPRDQLDDWSADFLHARPHGGESVAMLAARTRDALDALAGSETVLAVTHAGIIKAALAASGFSDPWRSETAFGAFVTLEWPCR